MEDSLLVQTLTDIRSDLREMERRLGLRIDSIQPQCQKHAERIGALEQSITAMDSQRKTILGMIAFAASLVGALSAYVGKFLLGR